MNTVSHLNKCTVLLQLRKNVGTYSGTVILRFSSMHMGQFLLLMIMMTNGLACWAPEK